MKRITAILTFLTVVVFMSSCKNKPTLQKYLVESQDKTEFMTIDVPASILKISSGKEAPEDVKKAVKSIKKINVLALEQKNNEALYNTEKEKLKKIFKSSKKYKSLMSMKDKRGSANIYYKGDTDAIDEVVVFGYGNDIGLGVARLLGENMDVSSILKAIQYINIDTDDTRLNEFKMIFKDNKLSMEERRKIIKDYNEAKKK